MMEQRKFKIRKNLKEYVRNILAREGVSHRFCEENEQMYCLVRMSGERFHKVVKRAYCEKMTEETGLLHLTYEESCDDDLCYGLMALFKASSYVVVGSKKQPQN